jgi:PKD repeat protein/type 1 glutamine amidotransferase
MRSAGRWVVAVVVVLGLAVPAAAVARPAEAVQSAAKLRSIGSLPQRAYAGDDFRLTVRVRNDSREAARPRLVVSVRKRKNGSGGRIVGFRRPGKLEAGASKRYRIRVKLPRGLAAGRYYVVVCARTAGRLSCLTADRRLRVMKRRKPPKPPGPKPDDKRGDILVLTESLSAADAHGSTQAGINALRDAGKDGNFKVDVAPQSAGAFTEESLETYRVVVFLNTSGNILSDNEQSAFVHFFQQGGGFVAIHSAIATEPDWDYMDELLGTRASGAEPAAGPATIKVADRVHDASKSLPEYWSHADGYYNFTSNVRGLQHVLATVDEKTYTGGAMGHDHPTSWCQDLDGGRAFYTALGHTADSFADGNLVRHLAGALKWAAGQSDPVYSDCGATVLANYKQVKISGPPNLNEPIGFDQLPDGRVIQTARLGQVRLHDPTGGTTTTLADFRNHPDGIYTHSEDGLYGPAVDNNFAQNKWVYIYYSPATVRNVPQSDGSTAAAITTPPNTTAPTSAASLSAWDQYVGYFQLSRFRFVDAVPGDPAHLDFASEQKIMRVMVNRGACCHDAGDIDFDRQNNLWLVTGDDTPSGGGNSGGFSPHNDMKTNETQTVRVAGTASGTFTLTFDGQTTAAIAWDATAAAIQSALEALSNVEPGDVVATGGPVNTANVSVNFRGRFSQTNVSQMVAAAAGGATVTTATTQEGDWFVAPYVDARRSALNTNDLRGKVLRITVADDGSYTVPAGNLFAPGTTGTRPEIYAMGFRNPFRIQVDSDNVAYVTDYSPDSQVPQQFRGPQGTGRVEVVRKPANYGWPLCMKSDLPYYRWNFNTSAPLDDPPQPYECGNPAKGPDNTSRWNTGATIDPVTAPGLVQTPPITQPDIWYSYRDNQNPPQGTPCFAAYGPSPLGTCPQLFPELFTGGVGPHGAAAYEFDPANPSETKFPPYYDGAMILGEFTQDTMREVRFDSQNRIFKINQFLNCGQALLPAPTQPFECDNPMDMQFGADGNFYLLTYGDGFFNANADAGMYRWEYIKGPEAPRAVVSATPRSGPAPLTVQFSSAGSGDNDPGDSITFAWDFDNNGSVDSTAPNPSFTYTTPRVYTARLTVTDSTGKTASASTVITVGNTAPTVTVTTPIDGDFFEWGQNLPYTVTVTDPEDATIDCSRVTVTFVLVHDTHGHAEESQTGCSGVLHTDAEDASHGGYLAGGISATYTDTGPNPLTTVSQNLVQIKRQEVEFVQDQSGTTLGNVGANDVGGGQNRTSLDPGDWIALNNRFNLTNMDKRITFRYAGGAAGLAVGTPRAEVEIRQGGPEGELLTRATLLSTGTNNNTYTSQTFDLNFTGSQRLYFVFRAVPGGPTAGLGNLNWVEFTGPGAGVNP